MRADVGVMVEERGDFLEGIEIIDHAFADAGALDFDGDFAAIAHLSAVHLSEGGGGNGLWIKGGEGVGDFHAELFAHHALDVFKRERRDVILAAGVGFVNGGG